MKFILITVFCVYFVSTYAEEPAVADSVVALVLSTNEEPINQEIQSRFKREEAQPVEIGERGGWRRKHKHRGGGQNYQNNPVGPPGGPIGSGSQSSSSSQSSSFSQGGILGSKSESSAQSSSFGNGGTGTGAGSSANSASFSSGTGSSSKSESSAQSSASGGFGYPGAYNKK